MVARSDLERTYRIDAEYFRKDFRTAELAVLNMPSDSVVAVAKVSDGNHFTISDAYTDVGVPYFRGQDVSGTFFAEIDKAIPITREAYDRPYMVRSHLKRGDVLLSIVGTIGSTALVDTDEPATCSCKLAILRPKSISSAYLATYLASSFGQRRIEQLTRGALQRGLILEDADQILIPRIGDVEGVIDRLILQSRLARDNSRDALAEAEDLLLDALGLQGWAAPEPLTYSRSAADISVAGRLDAQFHAPAVATLREELASRFDLAVLGNLGEVTNGRAVQYDPGGNVPIIRSGDVGKNRPFGDLLRASKSEPIFYLRKGDVLISSIGFGSIGRVEPVITDDELGTVSEVSVVRQSALDPHYVTAFLRSIAGQRQLDRLITGATGQLHLYPRDIRGVFIPMVPEELQLMLREKAQQAEIHRLRSESLLAAARRAVEIAIEDSEAGALRFLSEQGEGMDAGSA